MLKWLRSPFRAVKSFSRDEDGSYTVEAVIWLPMFVFILALIINISMVFNRQAEIIRIVQDANRSYSVGRFKTTAEVENFVLTAIRGVSVNATATAAVTNGVVNTSVDIPLVDMLAFDIFPVFRTRTVNVEAQYYVEV